MAEIKHKKDIRKEYSVAVRLTESEYEKLQKKIERSGLKQSEYLRKCINDKEIIVISGVETVAKELASIGNNMNQIAKHANRYGLLPPEFLENWKEHFDSLRRLSKELLLIKQGGNKYGGSESSEQ